MRVFGKIISTVIGLSMVVTGVAALFNPAGIFATLGLFLGISAFANGALAIVEWALFHKEQGLDVWNLAGAILTTAFGVFVLVSRAAQFAIDVFFAYVIAVWIIATGVMRIITAVRLYRLHKELDTVVVGKNWWLVMLAGILLVVLGVLCCVNALLPMALAGVFMAIGIIVAGCNIVSLVWVA